MRFKILALAGMAATLVTVTGAARTQEDECKISFPLQTSTGEITALTLFNFGQHLELQAETPGQQPLQDLTLSIDGKPADIFPSPGLDDMLVGFSTDEQQLEVSDVLLSALSEGKEARVQASTLDGKPANATFKLTSSVVTVSDVKAGCKEG